jgi:Tol biopolymer transport system component
VADGLPVNPVPGYAPFTASGPTIAYRAGGSAPTTQLTWFDRGGKRLGNVGPEGADISVSLSPDDTRAAVARINDPTQPLGGEPTVNVWVIDLVRGIPTRVTLDPANGDENPTWSPDGHRLAYASHIRGARAEVFLKDPNGSGASEQLTHTDASTHPIDWSPDGRYLLLQSISNAGVVGLSFVPLSGHGEMRPFVQNDFSVGQGQFSPDSRFVAYSSGESGRSEIFVRPFPDGTEKWQVSSAGGSSPRFRRDGRELYYVAPDGMLMAVALSLSPRFEAAPPVALFKTTITATNFNFYGGAAAYDVNRDGSRFLINTIARPGSTPSLNLILNWAPASAVR